MSRVFSLKELLQILTVIEHNCSQNSFFEGTNINSEQVKPGNIFFAIKGNKVDGHDFIKNAFSHGAQLCIIDHLTPAIIENNFTYILVENVLESFIALAKFCRKNLKGEVIAVTGSAGKSTTKNWLAEVFKNFKTTFSTYKNQNTDIGSALTLTNCPQDTDFCVMELGMSTRGEISKSSKIIEPDIVILTNVKPVHIENFHSVLEIAQEKADVVDGMKTNSVIFINKNETPFDFIVDYIKAKGKNVKIFSFGKDESCDCWMQKSELKDGKYVVDASIFGEKVKFKMQNVGEHFIGNAIAMLGVTKYLKLPISEVEKKIETLELYPGAGQIIDVKGKIKVIDETYNANPAAVVCAIKKLVTVQGKRKIVILGEMYELGDFLQRGLEDILECLVENKIDLVFTSGPLLRGLFDKLPKEMRGGHCDDVDVKILDGVINDGDVFLVKGSHGVNCCKGRMYEFVKNLCSYFC